ncbi:YobI family P-loop NTPase [Microbacterium schleiferi]|uniref:DNA-binding protein n=1 Tax=Microbacterium schleiferi TaxID=69362 RepID=A0ABU7V9K2_9MICO
MSGPQRSEYSAALPADRWGLVDLAPTFIASEHGQYVAAILAALANPRIRNIALSGTYGVGKSSILQRASAELQERAIELSLSTLAPLDMKIADSAVPTQATTTTNRIQQEIVKQLLYREKPAAASSSRFRRIERFKLGREATLAGLVGLVSMFVFLIAGWGATIARALRPLVEMGLAIYPLIFLVAAISALLARWLLHGRIHIKQFSAGPAAVTLDEKSVSYFDQYLDEIVYFFETSDYDIVIFEDIDRFNDSHIFETLRALNTLLNASPQIAQRPIRFVYAIKDSIFDRIGLEAEGRTDPTLSATADPAAAEAVRANRTKFFDLVIPVVPFITHRSARSVASQILEGVENSVAPDLIDLAGRFVPDMRLLKNVRNEFIVFRDRVFSGDGSTLQLSETDLFAMMLYKSTHLRDFEAIRLGDSSLDQLYAAGRELVTANIRRIERERRSTLRARSRASTEPSRATSMGDRLIDHIRRTSRAAGIPFQYSHYSLNDTARTEEDLHTVDFWRELSEATASAAVKWQDNRGRSLAFARDDLAAALGDDLNVERWIKEDQDELNDELERQREDLAFLRGADMGALIKRTDFEYAVEGRTESLQTVARRLLQDGLAFNLVREGYINRNFTLYTSTFHGDRVGPAATNFIIHHVEKNDMDVHFELDQDDVAAVVRERGDSALGDPALFNIAILDHLLASGDSRRAEIMIRATTTFSERAVSFLQAYLNGSSQLSTFISHFTRVSRRALTYLATQAEVDDDRRLRLVSAALASLAQGVKYLVDPPTGQYLLTNYRALPALVSDDVSPNVAARIRNVFAVAELRVPELEPLTPILRDAFVARDLYEITRENLQIALGQGASLALDAIRSQSEAVYDYVLRNLADYLPMVEDFSATNDSSGGFITTIKDVLSNDSEQLDDVILRASEESRIDDLGDVDEDAWRALAASTRFPATFGNITRYVATIGAVDGDLSEVLRRQERITESDSTSEEDKRSLAYTILAARSHLHSTIRVPLVTSLAIDEPLDAAKISPEKGPLFTLMIESGLVPDDVDTYTHIKGIDWKWREQFIAASRAFGDYMTPQLVGTDLAGLMPSGQIGQPVKLAILDDAAAYASTGGAAGIRELAEFALTEDRILPIDVVEAMPAARVRSSAVISLLVPHLDSLDDPRLFSILASLARPYSQLTSIGSDRPKIDNSPGSLRLLTDLKRRGIVSSFVENENPIVVNKKRK